MVRKGHIGGLTSSMSHLDGQKLGWIPVAFCSISQVFGGFVSCRPNKILLENMLELAT